MTRHRLRAAMPPAELAATYDRPHDHRRFPDHALRVAATIEVGRSLVGTAGATIADLSCGNGAVATGIGDHEVTLGDLAPGYGHHGPIEETVRTIDPVDLFVCGETLEHVDDPDLVLRLIRPATRLLLLSTPVEAWQDNNPEHYWAWSRADVEEMLLAARFLPVVYVEVDTTPGGMPYRFGIWGCQ